MIFSASNEQYLKIKEVVKTPIDEFLTFVNFLQRKNELDASRIRKNRKKN
jgi:hypothetical protein